MNPTEHNIESNIKSFALALAIARTDSYISHYLVRAAIMTVVTVTTHLSGWEVASVVATTLTGSYVASCAMGMMSLRLLRKAYAKQISRV